MNNEELFERLADELLHSDICEPSAIVSALFGEDLQHLYDNVLHQFGLELVVGSVRQV